MSRLFQLIKFHATLETGNLPTIEICQQNLKQLFWPCRSLELSVKELSGKNYSLVIKNLAELIEPSKSHWKIKTGKRKLYKIWFVENLKTQNLP